jgi:hypothetical protein
MKLRTVMVTAAVAALSFAAAGSAAAQTLGHQDLRMRASAGQITGSRLARGLLSASAYGADFKSSQPSSTGGRLLSTHILQTPGSLSCGSFANDINIYIKYWGNTAGAAVGYFNSAWRGSWPYTQYDVGQVVVQFATAHAASTFFNQAYSKFAACRAFAVPNPSDTSPGGGSYDVTDTSVSRTSISGHQAFETDETWVPSGNSSVTFYIGVSYAVSGADVYSLWEITGTNDLPSTKLMSNLIHRVQSLY